MIPLEFKIRLEKKLNLTLKNSLKLGCKNWWNSEICKKLLIFSPKIQTFESNALNSAQKLLISLGFNKILEKKLNSTLKKQAWNFVANIDESLKFNLIFIYFISYTFQIHNTSSRLLWALNNYINLKKKYNIDRVFVN